MVYHSLHTPACEDLRPSIFILQGGHLVAINSISKLLEGHRDAGAAPSPHEEHLFPLGPDRETFDEPVKFIPLQMAAIPSLEFAPEMTPDPCVIVRKGRNLVR